MASDDRVRFRLTYSSYGNLILVVGAFSISSLFFPWYSLATLAVITVIEVIRTVSRRATSITFDPDGIDVGLFLRTRHIRKPVIEFSGSRMRGVSVRDLRTGKSYLLTTMRRGRKLIATAEERGYAVLNRPRKLLN